MRRMVNRNSAANFTRGRHILNRRVMRRQVHPPINRGPDQRQQLPVLSSPRQGPARPLRRPREFNVQLAQQVSCLSSTRHAIYRIVRGEQLGCSAEVYPDNKQRGQNGHDRQQDRVSCV